MPENERRWLKSGRGDARDEERREDDDGAEATPAGSARQHHVEQA